MITIFPNIHQTKKGIVATPHLIVDSIKSGGKNDKIKDQVNAIKKEPDKSRRNTFKTQLPCIMWSGIFKERKKSGLQKHSGLICLDFDDVEDIENSKKSLCEDEYVYCCFISPSGKGLKVVIKIPADKDNHQSYFHALADYFNWIDVDSAAKDVSRVCYASHDPDIYFNPESKLWDTQKTKPQRRKKAQPSGGSRIPDNNALQVIKRIIDSKIDFVSGQKHDHLMKFAGWANRAGIPQQETINFYNANYDKEKVESVVSNMYKSYPSEFGTEPVKSLPSSKDEYLTFWIISKKEKRNGEVEIKPVFNRQKFISWLKSHGFARFHYTDSDWQLVRHEANIVQKVCKPDLKDFVFEYIESLPSWFDEISQNQLYELVSRGIHSFFSDELLEILPRLKAAPHTDTSNEGFLYFLNGVVKSNDKGYSLIKYSDLNGYVWKDQIRDRDFVVNPNNDNDYKTLLYVVAGGEDKDQPDDVFKERMSSLESTVGFLLHSYKDPKYCPAIVINDQFINEDNPEGGTGKGLFLNAISHLKRLVKIDGKLHKLESNFPFQAIDADTQIMVFEDVVKGWSFESLFPIITEGLTVEKKGKDSFYIKFKESPKVVITTNYTLKGEGNSHERRRYELEFHGHFRENPPFEYFGRRLFDDWSEEDWQAFDNYMAYCLVRFLQYGLKSPPVINLKERRLRERTHPEFVEFIRGWLKPGQFTSKQLHHELSKQNPDFEKYNQGTITRWIKYYMGHSGCSFDTGRISTELGYFRGFIVSHVPKETTENDDHIKTTEVVSDHIKVVKNEKEVKQEDDVPF